SRKLPALQGGTVRNRNFAQLLFNLAIFTLVAASVTAAGAFAAPPFTRIDAFLGLWQGVDSLDGSVVRLSLSDVNDDGVIELTQAESFYTFCRAMGTDFSLGRGVEVGTATVGRNRDALEVNIQLICIADNNEKHEQDPVEVEYTLRSRGKNLILPAFPQSPPIVLHRVAQ